ncbi:MAG TPA: zinc-binding dehydrogenase [Anaerolineales bacterium]|jgi:L-iditol 2-dehydrogenase|nr:zinc-binding dehydrogenase [Anaerolineales bacterium]
MKSVRLHGTGDLQIHEEPVPIAAAGEKLVRVKAVGVCGSDLHWFAEGSIGDANLEHPLVLGHEFAGITEDGQRVAIDPAIPCGHCESCEHGHPNLCANLIFAGHGKTDGALREWMGWSEKSLFPIPESISDADGAMLEPLGVAIHTVDLGKLRAGMTVGVFGCGPIGLLIIQVAKLSGAANIIATDKLPHRVEAAKSLGANEAFSVDEDPRLEEIRAATNGRGVDVAFEAAGTQAAVDTAFAAVSAGGKVVLAGIPDDDKTSFSASTARRKGLTIKLVRRMKHTYPRAIELVSKGLVDVRSVVTHRFPLEQAAEAFRVAERREGLKILIEV